ncbi:MAG: tetratricopeptide repeat protein [Heliobacteriaceae bacterium]|jgi:tetratricopeptide (TPR) repeat protein|nr:tetratricopeptide repeat protein [Heliobacteriaceae bacterium]
MKKVLSVLFTLLLIGGIAAIWFLFPDFSRKQVNKLFGVYDVYKGDNAYRRMKLQRAIDYYNNALRLYPEHYEAWYNLGNIYVVYEDYYSAADAYEKSIEHNPKFIMARMNYGIVASEKLGDFDAAINQYQAIIELKPKLISIPFIFNNRKSTKINKGIAYYNMGVAYKQKSIYADDNEELRYRSLQNALKSYQEAVKVLKKDYDARYNLALTYHLLGDYHDAGLNYCKAISLAPMNYEAHYNLAILLRHLKYYKESLDEMQKATSLITISDGISNRQRYVFDVMNELTRLIYSDTDKTFLEKIDDEPAASGEITYINGRLVASEALDKAILKNFKTCGSRAIFLEEIGEDYTERGSRVNVP